MKFRGDGTVYACTALGVVAAVPGLVGAPLALVIAGAVTVGATCAAGVAAVARSAQ